MLRDGFLRFCDDPELACCRAEAELGQLRNENAQLRSQLLASQRRERAAVEDLRLSAIELAEGTGTCIVCKHYPGLVSGGARGVCDECAAGECLFEWRGTEGKA